MSENPFSGHHVLVEAQIRYSNQWGGAGWNRVTNEAQLGTGVNESQLFPADVPVVQTGGAALMNESYISDNPFGNNTPGMVLISAPFRLMVTRLGKIT